MLKCRRTDARMRLSTHPATVRAASLGHTVFAFRVCASARRSLYRRSMVDGYPARIHAAPMGMVACRVRRYGLAELVSVN